MAKLIIFDTETTGLNEEDRIIQIGAIISELGNPNYFEEPYNELCSTDIPIKIESISIHGIRQKDIDDKPLFSQTNFKKRFDELNSEENYLIAHNIDFDKRMLEKEGYKDKINCKLIDTYQCALHLYEIAEEINDYKLPNHKLQTFRYIFFNENQEEQEAKKYNVEIKAHDAIGDVVILKMFLGKLYLRTIQKMFPQFSGKLKELSLKNQQEVFDKMVELSEKLAFVNKFININDLNKELQLTEIEKITFPFAWVTSGPEYIDWLFKKEKEKKEKKYKNFDKNLFFTLEMIKKNRASSEF